MSASVADPRFFAPCDLTDTIQQTFAEGRTAYCPCPCCWQQNLGAVTSFTSGSNPGHRWTEVDLFPGSSWSLPALKKQWTGTFTLLIDDFWTVAIGPASQVKWNSCLAQLHLPGRGWTHVSPLFNDGCVQEHHLFILWATWFIFLLAGIALSSWRGTECSEDFIVLYLVYWMSSFLSCLVVFVFRGCFVSAFGRHLAFCILPVLSQPENSWPTTRRFDEHLSLERARH